MDKKISSNLKKLVDGDKRTNKTVEKVFKTASKNPHEYTSAIIQDLNDESIDDEDGFRLRLSDLLEKIVQARPDVLHNKETVILKLAKNEKQKEVQWHLAQIISYMDLPIRNVNEAALILEKYYKTSKSKIVQAFSLQGLYELSLQDDRLNAKVKLLLIGAKDSDSPAVKSRAKKILKLMGKSVF